MKLYNHLLGVDMRIRNLLIGLSIFAVYTFLVTGASAKDLSAEQKSILKNYVSNLGKKGSIPTQFIQSKVPDRDLEKIGFVVLFTHEDPDGDGGNDYEQILTVFGNKDIGYKVIDSKKVGGKGYRSVNLEKLTHGDILLKVMFYSSEDPSCCPSIKGDTSYCLNKNYKLEEMWTTIFKDK